ncbi:MAG: MFS transporter [Scytonematopsis contorta HA4267-MV1]|jgi:HEAT repeat protein|nr:MFS transporter [Scytonematopsis contorta HA4267-MV1]
MELKNYWFAPNKGILGRLLSWVNLRPEESERTLLIFFTYTLISVGLRWVEDSAVAMFLGKFEPFLVPWIYISSGAIGAGFVFFYSWLQRTFPLRWVIVAIAPCMVLPLVLLVALHWVIPSSQVAIAVVFLLRLWVEAIYVVNDLNISIVSNQLFNIREIKRAYPLVTSGILVADVISGYSLPFLLQFVKLEQLILLGAVIIASSGFILQYLGKNYPQALAEPPQRLMQDAQHKNRYRLTGSIKRYALLLFTFIGLIQIIGVLIDFQYLTQVQSKFEEQEIARFLGIFNATAGLCQLAMQWFVSSRVLERFGVFVSVASLPTLVVLLLPVTIFLLGLFPQTQAQNLFVGLIIFKFFDDLLRYTFVASGGPLLFQPIPDKIRSRVQTLLGGIAEPIATCLGGFLILITIPLFSWLLPETMQHVILIGETVIVALICLGVICILQKGYVELLVLTAGRGELFGADVDLRAFKQAVIKALVEQGNITDKHSCIELLAQIDPKGAPSILAPMLPQLPPALQSQSLEVMLTTGASPTYLPYVNTLLDQPKESVTPEVLALALRYLWLSDTNLNLSQLEEYLQPKQHSLIRATAAALLLRQGSPMQKVSATKTLQRMLTHKLEQERVHGVKALSGAVYIQALRIHIPKLLNDDSLRVRQGVLEMIAANHLEEYFSALIVGLFYKSTRNSAMTALVKLENEAIPMLVKLATSTYEPEVVRMYAWRTIGQINTTEAIDTLWLYLEKTWGTTRKNILRTLLKIQKQTGTNGLVDKFHENRVETLVEEELHFLGEIYAAYIDFKTQSEMYAVYVNLQTKNHQEKFKLKERIIDICDLIEKALIEIEIDVKERLILILKLLYPLEKIHAAAFNLQSELTVNQARGLEILEHTINLPSKSVLLNILDKRPHEEKLRYLTESDMVQYEQTILSDRTRRLLTLGNLLSDWCLACCLHFANIGRIRLSTQQILIFLRHPTGFVREAALEYLSVASPRILLEILPQLQQDTNPIVSAQVKQLMHKYQIE